MTRRFSTTTKLPSLLPVVMSYRILGWGRCTSLVGTRRMPPSALRKFSLHSREITRLWRFWDLFMQIQVTRRRGRQLGYVCEFEEEGGMVCVWPWRRGRQLGYVCVTLFTVPWACSWSPAQSLERVGSCVSIAGCIQLYLPIPTEPPEEGDRAVSWWCWGMDWACRDLRGAGCAGVCMLSWPIGTVHYYDNLGILYKK